MHTVRAILDCDWCVYVGQAQRKRETHLQEGSEPALPIFIRKKQRSRRLTTADFQSDLGFDSSVGSYCPLASISVRSIRTESVPIQINGFHPILHRITPIYAGQTNPILIGAIWQSTTAVFSRPIDDWNWITGGITPKSHFAFHLHACSCRTCLSFYLRVWKHSECIWGLSIMRYHWATDHRYMGVYTVNQCNTWSQAVVLVSRKQC